MNDHVRELFDKDGNLIGCLLTAEAWQSVGDKVKNLLGIREEPAQAPEPLHEWETLKEYWDFNYEPDMHVHCECCGSSTPDWQQDEPRKFLLSSATLGGMVTFTCLECRAKVLKKHFKDEIVTECKPFQDKDKRLEARY